MLAQTFRRSLLEARSTLPPTFLLPLRASITTISHTTDPNPVPETLVNSTVPIPNKRLKDASKDDSSSPSSAQSPAKAIADLPAPTSIAPSQPTTPISDSVRTLLPLLKAQAPHYITIQIYGRSYLVTAGDIVRLPFLMSDVEPGDILRLDKATHLGSREFTLRAGAPIRGSHDAPRIQPYLDERLFVCRAVVMGTEAEPMRIIEKTKRRQRHVRKVKSKHKYTVIRITELTVNNVEDID